MKINEKDGNILQHIVSHCNDIETALEHFGRRYRTFEINPLFRNSCSMSIMQIGELAKSLSDGFIQETKSKIPWNEIKGMRSYFAHGYHVMDIKMIWNVVVDDSKHLNKFCKGILKENGLNIPIKCNLGLHR